VDDSHCRISIGQSNGCLLPLKHTSDFSRLKPRKSEKEKVKFRLSGQATCTAAQLIRRRKLLSPRAEVSANTNGQKGRAQRNPPPFCRSCGSRTVDTRAIVSLYKNKYIYLYVAILYYIFSRGILYTHNIDNIRVYESDQRRRRTHPLLQFA
jgi:hypothetical protein